MWFPTGIITIPLLLTHFYTYTCIFLIREFKKAEEALKKAKKDAELHGSSWKQREQELETLKLEVAELQQAVLGSRQQLQHTRHAAAALRRSLQAAADEHKQASVSSRRFLLGGLVVQVHSL